MEKIVHHLRSCIKYHCSDKNFVVLKVDLTNAFNLVSRQAILDDCAQRFPELLACMDFVVLQPAPTPMAPTGDTHLTGGSTAGGSTGPFLFALVLQRIVSMIYTDEECADLSHNAWYLYDGSLAGKSASVLRALNIHVVSSQGPALGFNINFKKCELYGTGNLSSFPSAIQTSNTYHLQLQLVILDIATSSFLESIRLP